MVGLLDNIPVVPVREARYVPTICDGNVALQGRDQLLHVDLNAARGGDRIAEIERRIRWAPLDTYQKHLVTGHPGSGKSTELHRLATALETPRDGRTFRVVFFDAKQRLDPSDIQLPDLLIALFSALWQDPQLHVPKLKAALNLGKQMLAWVRAIVPDIGTDLASEIPVLGTLFKNAELQRRFREKSWEYTARVIVEMGELLQAIRRGLVQRDEADDLVIIIDNLDKLLLREIGGGRTNHDLLFIEQLPKLEDLPVHMIVTFPVAFHAEQVQLRAAFAGGLAVQIPMVRVRPRGSQEDDPCGFDALRRLLDCRLDRASIFVDTAAIDAAIRASGGCFRDLLRIVSTAVVERGRVPVSVEDIERAVQRLVADFERVLQGKAVVPALHTIARTGSIPSTISPLERKWLLMNLIVLEYNGETWYDVHPIARRTRAYRDSAPTS